MYMTSAKPQDYVKECLCLCASSHLRVQALSEHHAAWHPSTGCRAVPARIYKHAVELNRGLGLSLCRQSFCKNFTGHCHSLETSLERDDPV